MDANTLLLCTKHKLFHWLPFTQAGAYKSKFGEKEGAPGLCLRYKEAACVCAERNRDLRVTVEP